MGRTQDDLLIEFFVRIDAPEDLIRASAACKTFRHLITDDAAFLDQYRSRHPPLLLGFVSIGFSDDFFLPAQAPHPNAPAALAFTGAAGFTLDRLPHFGRLPRDYDWHDNWYGLDAHGGRVLLGYPGRDGGLVLPEFAVFDPSTHKYTLMPPIPDSLLSSVLDQVRSENVYNFDAFFDPSGGFREDQFRVMFWTCGPTKGAILVYSSVSGTWSLDASIGL
ncbi:hypothetical protein PR202_ga03728 [Eleusine coracana subsp. coracana]|uniref:F-box domain-containing protein n=1 Tax=Eleusine coracana subsp. coracana TaxID=191504 RepID=A0AAV5BPB0_ELECO|nr:hypothetical protein PR202_ga03728 [Eleusine coracana subsp. coracana]